MSYTINEIELLGNVGNITPRQDNRPCHISLATTRGGYKTRDGREVPQRTDWHRITLYDRLAELAEHHVRKGDRLLIKGELLYNEYTTTDGTRRTTTEIRCHDLYFISRPGEQPQPTTTTDPTPNNPTPLPF